ncbi:unnamed protein product [Amoebophrya sp. A120]|nr:unnamed protein product [Amoebophrya sp. A120]|eukprot:GSA120T00021253001.1
MVQRRLRRVEAMNLGIIQVAKHFVISRKNTSCIKIAEDHRDCESDCQSKFRSHTLDFFRGWIFYTSFSNGVVFSSIIFHAVYSCSCAGACIPRHARRKEGYAQAKGPRQRSFRIAERPWRRARSLWREQAIV